ncbi:MAG: nitroreductase family protein [Pigeon pea little leaf phytoplasma]|uniref:Nitroreductase family protein n=1 Tax=Candidatus Phytoplasma fabacearum TaxID=2982628 RepID=A0ABU8ZSI1_9MOLU|nr:nitroreductase family protein ['Bituminaria bituminosa' little leaf phytoplasma]MDV3148592.1 nitroreductase family protein [Pigeon pea little leaf phytoplasma]MDO7983582.1 nitroreductase family protein ['Bituminaria bituminosa' little leaf phytoplasma]MDO8023718.1 nitroreductase family protein ['Bituminaria bituminosa' little leaf phytoplasma]MDO8030552.1 nitroreductase family protein ['Bituminaria bituminosa' little leaf phytoplasma]MDV3154182.1 nitroreductase family protein [Pigeon pea li
MKIKTIRSFDPDHRIPTKIWQKVFQEIRYTPSSFDLQPWRFFIINKIEHKEKLKKCIIGNIQQTQNSSAIIILCGNINKVQDASYIYNNKLKNKNITLTQKEIILKQIQKHYHNMNQQKLKNEIFFECGLIAGNLAITLQNFNYNTCFMGGCHFDKLNELFNIDNKYIPIILIAVGQNNQKDLIESKINKNIENSITFKLDINDFVHFL